MKIGLFLLETARNVGGLEVYEVQLSRALPRVDRENEYVIFCLDPRVPDLLNITAAKFTFRILQGSRSTGVLLRARLAFRRETCFEIITLARDAFEVRSFPGTRRPD